MLRLELHRAHISERGMESFSVVPHLDVLEKIPLRFRSGLVSTTTDTLSLQRAEETLHRRVVKAVASSAHTSENLVACQNFLLVL